MRLDHTRVADGVSGRVVLVTGACGSIGSELCRQIMRFGPKRVVALERSEYNLFQIKREIRRRFPDIDFLGLVADIQDEVGCREIFARVKPEIIYHAAAHKHVPLMEANPREAVRNNVLGTRVMADLAIEFQVRKFLLISTDKAVNPLNIMGYSKRLAELIIQSRARRVLERAGAGASRAASTEFVAVRFGNVLGSSGSAVEIFRKQIESGGPLTVTHPECDRFFMTTPEAVEIVLHAGAHGQRGEIYMLDMGKPVKIMDVSRLDERLTELEACTLDTTCDVGLLLKQVVNALDGAHRDRQGRPSSSLERHLRVVAP